jgi:hypothetical protein
VAREGLSAPTTSPTAPMRGRARATAASGAAAGPSEVPGPPGESLELGAAGSVQKPRNTLPTYACRWWPCRRHLASLPCPLTMGSLCFSLLVAWWRGIYCASRHRAEARRGGPCCASCARAGGRSQPACALEAGKGAGPLGPPAARRRGSQRPDRHQSLRRCRYRRRRRYRRHHRRCRRCRRSRGPSPSPRLARAAFAAGLSLSCRGATASAHERRRPRPARGAARRGPPDHTGARQMGRVRDGLLAVGTLSPQRVVSMYRIR